MLLTPSSHQQVSKHRKESGVSRASAAVLALLGRFHCKSQAGAPRPLRGSRGLEMRRLQRGRSSLLLSFVCKHRGPQRASLAAGGRAGPSWAAVLGQSQEAPVKTWLLFLRLLPSFLLQNSPLAQLSCQRDRGVCARGEAQCPSPLPGGQEPGRKWGPAVAAAAIWVSNEHYSSKYSSKGSLSEALGVTGRGREAA